MARPWRHRCWHEPVRRRYPARERACGSRRAPQAQLRAGIARRRILRVAARTEATGRRTGAGRAALASPPTPPCWRNSWIGRAQPAGSQRCCRWASIKLAQTRIPDHAAVSACVRRGQGVAAPRTVAGRQCGAAALSARAFTAGAGGGPEPGGPLLAPPDWLIRRLRSAWPGHWRSILRAGNRKPPMWLRVNRAENGPCVVPGYAFRYREMVLLRSAGRARRTADRPAPTGRSGSRFFGRDRFPFRTLAPSSPCRCWA